MPRKPALFSEAEFTRSVVERVNLYGGLAMHHPDSRRLVGDAGAPDLIIVIEIDGRETVLYRELKLADGRTSKAQKEWGRRLTAAGQDWAVWRPEDMDNGRMDKELGR